MAEQASLTLVLEVRHPRLSFRHTDVRAGSPIRDTLGTVVRSSIAPRRPHPSAAIFDVDGTLCDVRPVRKYVVPDETNHHFKKDFARFHQESLGCRPHTPVREFAQKLHSEGIHILIVSGRGERWTELTKQWLQKWDIEYEEIYLRPDKDFRADVQVKTDIGEKILSAYSPVVAIDDGDDIIGVWRSLAIPTVQVREDGTLDTQELGAPIGMHASVMNAIKQGSVS
ncbi:HAD family acid phosphatase [Kocuria sp. UBA5001]|uniref:phosphatase domain-containing protein n=1 Tax=Kocuria sp. UBA5001 TaxID=1946674 RepID=UPI0032E46357